jgi:hypothetical protein
MSAADRRQFLVELSLMESGFCRYLPSVVAGSALFLAAYALKKPVDHIELVTGYSADDPEIWHCIESFCELHRVVSMEGSRYRAVVEKYSQSSLHRVARISVNLPPRRFHF